jgi:hypothetical protein
VRRDLYRFGLILLIAVLFNAAWIVWWSYFASPEDKAKFKELRCKPNPVYGNKRAGCP